VSKNSVDKKILTTWNKALKTVNNNRIVEMRLSLGIPEVGFSEVKHYDEWHESNVLIKEDILKKMTDEEIQNSKYARIHKYKQEIQKMNLLIENGFGEAIDDFLFYGNVSAYVFSKCNPTGCSIQPISKHNLNDIEDGLYIKMSPDTTVLDLKNFVKNNSPEILWWKKAVYKDCKGKRITTESFERNNLIYKLNKVDKTRLEELAMDMGVFDESFKRRRDTIAVAILKKFGFLVTESNFRKIAHKEKKERES